MQRLEITISIDEIPDTSVAGVKGIVKDQVKILMNQLQGRIRGMEHVIPFDFEPGYDHGISDNAQAKCYQFAYQQYKVQVGDKFLYPGYPDDPPTTPFYYTRGQAIKKARVFGGKIVKATE